MRRDSGKAIAAPHSGAYGPTQARKVFALGAIATSARWRGRGSPGKVSLASAAAASEWARRSSCG